MPTLELSDMVLPAYYEVFGKRRKRMLCVKGARASGKE